MKYALYRIYGKKSPSSNKNLLADMLNEIAEAIGFNMLYLREDYSEAKGYLIDEEDIPLLNEMVEIAKSSAGKRIRCKDFSVDYAETLEYFMEAFVVLAAHNSVPVDMLKQIEFKMLAKTSFCTLKNDLRILDETLFEECEHYYFAPNDYFPNEDDELSDTDKYIFLMFLLANTDEEIKNIRGVYWCFHELREGSNQDAFIKQMHSMTDDEKRIMVEKTFHYVEFENRLQDDEEYQDTIIEFARIASGKGKLQDKKKELPLAKKLCEIMDKTADGFLTPDEYAYGVPKRKKAWSDEEDIQEQFSESHNMLEEAVKYYNSLRWFRKNTPFTEEDERMIEYFYRLRFDEHMF